MHQENKILLTISVMASNRKETTEKCLKSLEKLRKEVPCELIITDTGCEPDMRKMVESYADRVIEFTWCNDFSKARQASLDIAQGEWYMYLDDDEWFIDTDALIDFFKGQDHIRCDFATYVQRNYYDWDGEEYNDVWVGRMIKIVPGVHFEDKIHEHLEPVKDKNIAAIQSVVEHYGYIHKSVEEERAHYERNRNLLLEMIAENPQNIRPRIHLLQEYRAMNEFKALLDAADEGLLLLQNVKQSEDRNDITGFYAGKIMAQTALGKPDEVLQTAKEIKADQRVTDTGRAYSALYEANANLALGNIKEAQTCCKEYLRIANQLDLDPAEKFLQSTAVFAGKAFGNENLVRIYSMLLLTELKQNQLSHIDEYVDKLGWESKHPYIYGGLPEAIIDAGLNLATATNVSDSDENIEKLLGVALGKIAQLELQKWTVWYAKLQTNQGIPLSSAVLECDIEIWMQELEQYANHCGLSSLLDLQEALTQALDAEEIHLCYLNLYAIRRYLCESVGAEGDTVAESAELFLQYAQLVQQFEALYNEQCAQKESENAMMADCIRAAEQIRAAFEATKEVEQMKALRNAAVEDPELAPAIRNYITLLSNAQKTNSTQVNQEMEALKQQLMQQAKELNEAGQTEDAIAILTQLQNLLPTDQEIQNMLQQLQRD